MGNRGFHPIRSMLTDSGKLTHPVSVSFTVSDTCSQNVCLLWTGLEGRKFEARETGEAGKLKNVVVDQKKDLPPPFSVIGRGSAF